VAEIRSSNSEESSFVLTVSRYLAIMLCALGLSVGLTHALAVTPDPRLAGATTALRLMATIAAVMLAVSSRNRPGFGLAVTGTLVLVLATLVWATSMTPLIAASGVPVPAWARSQVIARATDSIPGGNIDLAALSIWLIGMSCLVLSAIRQPVARRSSRGPIPLMRETLSRM
jgi:hypothetical protein